MRIKIWRPWATSAAYEVDLETHIADELQQGSESGRLEDVEDNVKRVATAIARMCNVLVDKGVLTLGEVNEMIGERHNVEEVT